MFYLRIQGTSEYKLQKGMFAGICVNFYSKSYLYPGFILLVLHANLDLVCTQTGHTELYKNCIGKVSISFVIPVTFSNLPASSAPYQHQNWITVI